MSCSPKPLAPTCPSWKFVTCVARLFQIQPLASPGFGCQNSVLPHSEGGETRHERRSCQIRAILFSWVLAAQANQIQSGVTTRTDSIIAMQSLGRIFFSSDIFPTLLCQEEKGGRSFLYQELRSWQEPSILCFCFRPKLLRYKLHSMNPKLTDSGTS